MLAQPPCNPGNHNHTWEVGCSSGTAPGWELLHMGHSSHISFSHLLHLPCEQNPGLFFLGKAEANYDNYVSL